MKRISRNIAVFLLLIIFSVAQKANAQNEKLFFDEQKFVEIRQRIDNEFYAKQVYIALQKGLKVPESNADFDPLWS